MCGASGEQMDLEHEQAGFFKTMTQMAQDQYGKQQAIWGPMAEKFQSIFDAGPSQTGFSQEQLNNLRAQSVEGTAENYKAASKAVNENLAARGGGESGFTSGAEGEISADLAASSAQEQSRQESQIVQTDYDTGRDMWKTAAGGLDTIATGENPTAYLNAATEGGSAASKTAGDIAAADNSWITAAEGAAGSIAGGYLGRHK